MSNFIYPGGDEQPTLNLGLATWGMDEVLANNMILIDNFAGSGGGSGTVTSFSSGNIDTIITSSVATPTTTPALTFSLNTQVAGTVWAGPTSGGALAPTFRALVLSDISNGVQMASVTLTTAQILAATAVQIIAAPAAGTFIRPVSMETHYTFANSSISLSAGNTACLLEYSGLATTIMTCPLGVNGASNNQFAQTLSWAPAASLTASSIEAKAMTVGGNGTYSTSGGTGTVAVTVAYYVDTF